jgi:hypothetical protein
MERHYRQPSGYDNDSPDAPNHRQVPQAAVAWKTHYCVMLQLW